MKKIMQTVKAPPPARKRLAVCHITNRVQCSFYVSHDILFPSFNGASYDTVVICFKNTTQRDFL
jgi:hypothetical protein